MITRIGAVAAHFGRDLDRGLNKITGMIEQAHRRGLDLLVLPGATLGGYVDDLRRPRDHELPPTLALDSPLLAEVAARAGRLVLCLGFCELDRGVRYNTVVCVNGDGILGRHRKVHQPSGEHLAYAPGAGFIAFDTPLGRLGLLVDYDKTFPEAARTLALDGAVMIAALSAWPANVTDRTARLVHDRQSRLFDLYDMARAAENQVVLVSSNLTGSQGDLRFLGQAKVVGPGGDVLARTGSKGALAIAELDVAGEVARARRVLAHLDERRPATYHPDLLADPLGVPR